MMRMIDETYEPGGTVVATVTLSSDSAGALSRLAVEETLPSGWSYETLQEGTPPQVPNPGATGTLVFQWPDGLPAADLPLTFAYRVRVPDEENGTHFLTGRALYLTAELEYPTDVVTTRIEEASGEGIGCAGASADKDFASRPLRDATGDGLIFLLLSMAPLVYSGRRRH